MAAPKLLCDTKGMDRKRWLACRMHGPNGDIPYTIGGSDVSVVFGVNPWTTPLELWRMKKGLLQPDDETNFWAKEMGHRMEPIVARCYADITGNTVVEDTGLYQHGDFPFALANLDFGLTEKNSGENGVLECKTTTYHNAYLWAGGMVPYYYELQCRFYLAVKDLDFADIVCMWGFNPETDMAIVRINRDKVIENDIFERLSAFVDSLEKDIPPAMTDVDPTLTLKALARIQGKGDRTLPTIELPAKLLKRAANIAVLQQEIRELDQRKRKLSKVIDAHAVPIAELMDSHHAGIIEASGDRYRIEYKPVSRISADRKKLEKDYPAVFQDVRKESVSRSVKVWKEKSA